MAGEGRGYGWLSGRRRADVKGWAMREVSKARTYLQAGFRQAGSCWPWGLLVGRLN